MPPFKKINYEIFAFTLDIHRQTDAVRECFLRGLHRHVKLPQAVLVVHGRQAQSRQGRADGQSDLLRGRVQRLGQLGHAGLLTGALEAALTLGIDFKAQLL